MAEGGVVASHTRGRGCRVDGVGGHQPLVLGLQGLVEVTHGTGHARETHGIC